MGEENKSVVETISYLVKHGYTFSAIDNQIHYKCTSKKKIEETGAFYLSSAFQILKENKTTAIEYISSFVRLEVLYTEHTANFFQVRYTMYNSSGDETHYNIAYYESIQALADYINAEYVDNKRFDWIYAVMNRAKRTFIFTGRDKNQIPAPADPEMTVSGISSFEQFFLIPLMAGDPLYSQCPGPQPKYKITGDYRL